MNFKLSNNDLFLLIQSLSKAEKRHFRLLQKGETTKKDYIRLFDFLLKQQSYNIPAIKEHFKANGFIKRLPAVKLYLYNSILKSLRALSNNQSITQQVHGLIADTELLYKKGLYNQCVILLSRAKTLADDNEINFLRLQILRIQRRYAIEQFKQMKIYSPVAIRKEELTILKQMEMVNKNEALANALHTVLFKEGSIRTTAEYEGVKEIRDKAKAYAKDSKIAFRAAFLNLYLNGAAAFLLGNIKEAIDFGGKQISIWEENPQQLLKNPSEYIKSFNTLFQRALRLNQDDVFEKNINRLESFMVKIKEKKNVPLEVLGFVRITSNYLYYYTKKGMFEKAVAYYNSIQVDIKKYTPYMDEWAIIEQQFFVAYSYFGNKELSNAKKWLNKILNEPKLSLKTDLQVVCRIFEIVIYIDQDDIESAENRIPRLYRFLSELGRLYPFEQAILNCLQLLVDTNGNYQTLNHTAYNKELAQIKKGTVTYSSFDYFDAHSWLVAKKENMDLSEVMQKKELT